MNINDNNINESIRVKHPPKNLPDGVSPFRPPRDRNIDAKA